MGGTAFFCLSRSLVGRYSGGVNLGPGKGHSVCLPSQNDSYWGR